MFSLKMPFRYFTGFVCVFLKIHIIPRVIIHSFHQTGWISRMTGESILVVDDKDQLRQFCSILEKKGYSVRLSGRPRVCRGEAIPVGGHRREEAGCLRGRGGEDDKGRQRLG